MLRRAATAARPYGACAGFAIAILRTPSLDNASWMRAFLADHTRAHGLRRLDLGQGPDGMWIVDGRLDQEGGAYLSAALEAVPISVCR